VGLRSQDVQIYVAEDLGFVFAHDDDDDDDPTYLLFCVFSVTKQLEHGEFFSFDVHSSCRAVH
jgi:hypothetical protein